MDSPVATNTRRVELIAAFDARFSDFDAMAGSPVAWDQKYDHIGRGSFDGRIAQVVLNTMQVGRVTYRPGIMQRGCAPPGSWVIALPVAVEGTLHLRGRQVAIGQPLLVGPCDDMAFTANGAAGLAIAAIPVEQIERWMWIRRGGNGLARRYLDRAWTVSEGEIARRGATVLRLLTALLQGAQEGIHQDTLELIEGALVDTVLGMVPSSEVAEPLHRRARTALKLRDMLLDNVETPMSVGAMCESLGVRERTLFLSCLEAFGRPPKRLLLELRLNAARRALTHPEAERTVTTVASRFGFLHFGHFSAEYFRQFGELPSATLNRSLGSGSLVTAVHSQSDGLNWRTGAVSN
ncbi:AraC family transcriptional regulator [Arvimicrobium flavum]|uniref:AraC family transcriptional regulator n=1 Tax=Arvimicrobium flavum TaxID=3393320 RepID=UPI00237B65F2|nr:AraC family transcriptional regulator [Mesorhizobium shangrilense]